eukprot:gene16096-biopygen8425
MPCRDHQELWEAARKPTGPRVFFPDRLPKQHKQRVRRVTPGRIAAPKGQPARRLRVVAEGNRRKVEGERGREQRQHPPFAVVAPGISPAGISPAGISPAGINPAGISPAGTGINRRRAEDQRGAAGEVPVPRRRESLRVPRRGGARAHPTDLRARVVRAGGGGVCRPRDCAEGGGRPRVLRSLLRQLRRGAAVRRAPGGGRCVRRRCRPGAGRRGRAGAAAGARAPPRGARAAPSLLRRLQRQGAVRRLRQRHGAAVQFGVGGHRGVGSKEASVTPVHARFLQLEHRVQSLKMPGGTVEPAHIEHLALSVCLERLSQLVTVHDHRRGELARHSRRARRSAGEGADPYRRAGARERGHGMELPASRLDIAQAKEDEDGEGRAKEWMYEVGRGAVNPWELYNQAVGMWVAGNGAAARRLAGGAIGDG